MMDGHAGMMWGMGLLWLLVLVVLLLGAAALVVRQRRAERTSTSGA
jgi:uncharacterized membrane protein